MELSCNSLILTTFFRCNICIGFCWLQNAYNLYCVGYACCHCKSVVKCWLAAMINAAADIDDIAAALEDTIFKEFRSTETKYKNRIRSRIANLKVANVHCVTRTPCYNQSLLVWHKRVNCVVMHQLTLGKASV